MKGFRLAMYFLYSLFYVVALIFFLPFEYFKRPRDIRRRWIREKFGFLSLPGIAHHTPSIWVHAVSVGEVMASLPLLQKLRTAYPRHIVILSTITDTGQRVARERAPEGVRIVYLPFDIPFFLKSVIRRTRPRMLIIIETELWPNLLRVFRENDNPVILLNGRISERSFHGYRKISFFMKKVLSSLNSFGMQDETYAERLRKLGAERSKIEITGSFKFDADPPAQIPLWALHIGKPLIVAGSTHEGEEEMMTTIFFDLRRDFPGLNLIIAPRHPERFGSVADMLRARGVRFIRRTEIQEQKSGDALYGTIILLDSVGELSSVYGISSVAVIGKSFRGHGGQNPLEAAYWGIPVVCGPHMENFPVILDFYKAGAALQVSEERLPEALRELLLSPERAGEIGRNARKIHQENTGAVEKAMKIIEQYLAVR